MKDSSDGVETSVSEGNQHENLAQSTVVGG